jgi:hypothetical protein
MRIEDTRFLPLDAKQGYANMYRFRHANAVELWPGFLPGTRGCPVYTLEQRLLWAQIYLPPTHTPQGHNCGRLGDAIYTAPRPRHIFATTFLSLAWRLLVVAVMPEKILLLEFCSSLPKLLLLLATLPVHYSYKSSQSGLVPGHAPRNITASQALDDKLEQRICRNRVISDK